MQTTRTWTTNSRKYKIRGDFAPILHFLTHAPAQSFPQDIYWDPLNEVEVVDSR